MNEIIFDDLELEVLSDCLLDEFANSVEEDNRAEGFGAIISWLIWLGDNNRG